MTTTTISSATANQSMHKGAQIGLSQFDEALNQLNATRNDCQFDIDIQNDADMLLLFVERLQSAANKLHEQCNR